jgi:peptide deformylase
VAVLKVAQMGHPVLRRVSEPIDPNAIPSEPFQRLCDDLLETMEEYDGAGLAAPQVALPIRVVVLTLTEEDGPEIWVNPVLTALGDARATMVEGCLSVEGLRGRVKRPVRLHARFLDRDGTPHAYVLQGFPAVVAQHECDHLDGVLYVDRVEPKSLAFTREVKKYGMPDLEVDGPEVPADDVSRWEDVVVEVDAELPPEKAFARAAAHLQEPE